MTPPDALRGRLMQAVTTTQQERPVVVALAQRSRLRRTLPRLAMAAAFLVGTVGVGGYVVERGQVTNEHNRNVAITSVLAAADASTTAETFDGGGNVRLVSSESTNSAVIVANDLPTLKGGKVYQVWMINGNWPKSQGTFAHNGTMIMKGVKDADRVAITVEPKGGSTQPTTAPIATIAV